MECAPPSCRSCSGRSPGTVSCNAIPREAGPWSSFYREGCLAAESENSVQDSPAECVGSRNRDRAIGLQDPIRRKRSLVSVEQGGGCRVVCSGMCNSTLRSSGCRTCATVLRLPGSVAPVRDATECERVPEVTHPFPRVSSVPFCRSVLGIQ